MPIARLNLSFHGSSSTTAQFFAFRVQVNGNYHFECLPCKASIVWCGGQGIGVISWVYTSLISWIAYRQTYNLTKTPTTKLNNKCWLPLAYYSSAFSPSLCGMFGRRHFLIFLLRFLQNYSPVNKAFTESHRGARSRVVLIALIAPLPSSRRRGREVQSRPCGDFPSSLYRAFKIK